MDLMEQENVFKYVEAVRCLKYMYLGKMETLYG